MSVSNRASDVCKGPEEEGVQPPQIPDAAACRRDQGTGPGPEEAGLPLQGGVKPCKGFRKQGVVIRK